MGRSGEKKSREGCGGGGEKRRREKGSREEDSSQEGDEHCMSSHACTHTPYYSIHSHTLPSPHPPNSHLPQIRPIRC